MKVNLVVSLDASLLKHIVMNLVSNASKFSSEAGTIEIKTINHDHQITLSVKDHGIGISKEDQKHLMERFFGAAMLVIYKVPGWVCILFPNMPN